MVQRTATDVRAASPTDGDEVRAFLAGDPAAFDRLVDAYQRPVLGLCQRLSGSVHDARDLFQEIFLQAWRSLADLRDPESFRAWLFRIAMRKARRLHLRRGAAATGELAGAIAHGAPDRVEQAEEVRRLHDGLRRLPPRQREVVLLRHYHSLSYAEIGQALDISEPAARASHYQGLRRLRRELRDEETGS